MSGSGCGIESDHCDDSILGRHRGILCSPANTPGDGCGTLAVLAHWVISVSDTVVPGQAPSCPDESAADAVEGVGLAERYHRPASRATGRFSPPSVLLAWITQPQAAEALRRPSMRGSLCAFRRKQCMLWPSGVDATGDTRRPRWGSWLTQSGTPATDRSAPASWERSQWPTCATAIDPR